MTVRSLSLPGETSFSTASPTPVTTAPVVTPTETGAISTSTWSSYSSGIYQTPTAYNIAWENPIPLSNLFKNLASIPVKDAKRIVNVFEENAKSLEDHLDSGYLKVSGGAVNGTTTFGSTVNLFSEVNLGQQSLYSMLPPVGSIMPYAGTGAPLGWLLCDGTGYLATTYPSLYNVLGSAYNTSTGLSEPPAGYFRVPNLKARMPVGVNSEITAFNTRGKSGGSTTVTITVAQLPSHKHANTAALTSGTVSITDPGHGHTITDPGHGHTINDHTHTNQVTTIIPAGTHAHNNVTDYVSAGTNGASTSPTVASISTTSLSANSNTTGVAVVSNTTGVTGSVGTGITVTNVDTGSGNAVDNMSPYLVLNYIIKT